MSLTFERASEQARPRSSDPDMILPRVDPQAPVQPVLGVIDMGVAFWNPRFRLAPDQPASRFVDIGFLSPGNAAATEWIGDGAGMAHYLDLASQSGGEAAVIEELGQAYPASAFASHAKAGRIFAPSGFNHGTAMASIATGDEGGPEASLFALELPSAVLLDGSGQMLQSLLPFALHGLLSRILHWAQQQSVTPEINLLMAFAFLGGPLDGSHPAARSLDRAVQAAQAAGISLKIFVPMGNQRQDQAHAVLTHGQSGQATPPLRWFLPPDDYVENSVEVICPTAAPITLTLADPGGTTASATFRPGDVYRLMNEGKVIGVGKCAVLPNGQHQLKLMLAQTAAQDLKSPVAMFGDWQLSFDADTALGEIKLWILREDGHDPTLKLPPARQAWFRDQNYVRRRPDGAFWLIDSTDSPIKRLGTASVLASAQSADIFRLGAEETLGTDSTARPSWYSGAFDDGQVPHFELVDDGYPSKGIWACGNGGPRQFRVSGTSAAAALAAGRFS